MSDIVYAAALNHTPCSLPNNKPLQRIIDMLNLNNVLYTFLMVLKWNVLSNNQELL